MPEKAILLHGISLSGLRKLDRRASKLSYTEVSEISEKNELLKKTMQVSLLIFNTDIVAIKSVQNNMNLYK